MSHWTTSKCRLTQILSISFWETKSAASDGYMTDFPFSGICLVSDRLLRWDRRPHPVFYSSASSTTWPNLLTEHMLSFSPTPVTLPPRYFLLSPLEWSTSTPSGCSHTSMWECKPRVRVRGTAHKQQFSKTVLTPSCISKKSSVK